LDLLVFRNAVKLEPGANQARQVYLYADLLHFHKRTRKPHYELLEIVVHARLAQVRGETVCGFERDGYVLEVVLPQLPIVCVVIPRFAFVLVIRLVAINGTDEVKSMRQFWKQEVVR